MSRANSALRNTGGGARDRKSPLRARRRRIRAGIAFSIMLVLIGIGYGVHYVSYLPQFNVRTVVVEGAERLPQQLVRTYVESELHSGSYRFIAPTNILTYPREALEIAVANFFPRIKSVSISRASLLATAAVVHVEERSAFARWCPSSATELESECSIMDESGFIFASASSTNLTSSTAYVFSGGIASSSPIGKTFEAGHIPGILALLRLLQNANFVPLGADVVDEKDFNVHLGQGFFLKVSFGGNPDVLVRNLQLVLNSEVLQGKQSSIEYIDLRFGNRVYYKLRGQAEVQSE